MAMPSYFFLFRHFGFHPGLCTLSMLSSSVVMLDHDLFLVPSQVVEEVVCLLDVYDLASADAQLQLDMVVPEVVVDELRLHVPDLGVLTRCELPDRRRLVFDLHALQ